MFFQYLCLILLTLSTEFINASNYRLAGTISGLAEEVSPSTARIFMDGGKQIAIPRDNGKFYFHDLEVGYHSIEIHLNGYEWRTYKIDVRNDGKIKTYIQGKENEPLPPQLIIYPMRVAKYIPV